MRAAEPAVVTRAFLLLVTGHFLQALGYSSMLLLPLYLATLGASRTEIGTAMASASVGGLLLRPVVGWALDALGRKPTLVAGTLLLASGMGLVGLVDALGPTVYVARVLFGIGAGACMTGYFTFVADLLPPARRTEGIALFGLSGLLPLVINPIVQLAGVEGAGLRWVFPGVGLVVLSSLLALRALPEARPAHGREPLRLAAVVRALRRRTLAPVWLATVAFAGLVATFMAFATVTAENRDVPRPAMLWLTYAGGAAIVRVFGARLPDRVGPANVLAPALGAYGAAALCAAAAETQLGFLVAGALGGLGHGYCFPVLTSQVVSRSPERLRGSAVAMFTALWEVSALALTPLFGAVADAHGDGTMFSVAALAGALGLALWAVAEHRFGDAGS